MPQASEEPEPLDPEWQSAQEVTSEKVNSVSVKKRRGSQKALIWPNRGQESPKTLDTSKRLQAKAETLLPGKDKILPLDSFLMF